MFPLQSAHTFFELGVCDANRETYAISVFQLYCQGMPRVATLYNSYFRAGTIHQTCVLARNTEYGMDGLSLLTRKSIMA